MRAVFLDRDGVINEMVYYHEHGIIDSPFTVAQFRLLPGITQAINRFHDIGYKVVVVSNQPGVAKGHMSLEIFEEIRKFMVAEMARAGASLDGEYYCFHHPEAIVEGLRVDCMCRKPKPGLLLEAANEMGIELTRSWMIGDGLTDIQAGKSAGCRTILLGKMKCELCSRMDENDSRPDAVCASLSQACDMVKVGC